MEHAASKGVTVGARRFLAFLWARWFWQGRECREPRSRLAVHFACGADGARTVRRWEAELAGAGILIRDSSAQARTLTLADPAYRAQVGPSIPTDDPTQGDQASPQGRTKHPPQGDQRTPPGRTKEPTREQREQGEQGEASPRTRGPSAEKSETEAQEFVRLFAEVFDQRMGVPYGPKRKDFVIATQLLKEHGRALVEEMAQVAFGLAETQDFWRKGISIPLIQSQWRQLLLSARTPDLRRVS
jgi:hypothetical protein